MTHSNIDAFNRYLKELGIQYFAASEFGKLNRRAGWSGPLQVLPENNIWPRMALTIKFADELRNRLRAPVSILSSYRPLTYNRLIKSSSDTSQHVQFRALDLTHSDYAKMVRVADTLVAEWRQAGFKIGYGKYPDNRFIHIDVGRKFNADF